LAPGARGTEDAKLVVMRRVCAFFRMTILLPALLLAPARAEAIPRIDLSIGGEETGSPSQTTGALKILAALTVLSLAPAILMLLTSFTRIVIVLNFVRMALGVQGMPPNQILLGLALMLTFFVMSPVGLQIHEQAIKPYTAGTLSEQAALDAGLAPLRQFMLKQTRVKDLKLFLEISRAPEPKDPSEVPMTALIPAFVISELTTAFHMGFLIFIPFLLLDFVMASVLMTMGMVMLPPALISLPLKVMLFVLVDGWHLVVGSLLRSFEG
jgi:flagellar biosynthesis protein FliP